MTLQTVVFSSKTRISSRTPSGSFLGKRDGVISVARISSRHSRQITLSFCAEFLPVSCVAAISFCGRLSKFNDNSSRFCFLKVLHRRDDAMSVAQGRTLSSVGNRTSRVMKKSSLVGTRRKNGIKPRHPYEGGNLGFFVTMRNHTGFPPSRE